MNTDLHRVATQFAGGRDIDDVQPLGNGLINDTFHIIISESSGFVLQQINTHVFAQPDQIMANLQHLVRHLRQKPPDKIRLQIPAPLPTNNGEYFFLDDKNRFWRALELIRPAESREWLSSDTEAEQVGFALGHFHRLCSDLQISLLYDTLPEFHITPAYFRHYQNIHQPSRISPKNRLSRHCQEFIEAFHPNIDILEQAKHEGILMERIIHGDPKLNNFLFFPGADLIISLIDLDTVKPGLIHYDLGDCLRSCCHMQENDRFDLHRCRLVLENYLCETKDFLTSADYDYIYSAVLLIPFELGLRFYSDYLQGNHYFKVRFPTQNLQRAARQFKLCESIANQRSAIEDIVNTLKNSRNTQESNQALKNTSLPML